MGRKFHPPKNPKQARGPFLIGIEVRFFPPNSSPAAGDPFKLLTLAEIHLDGPWFHECGGNRGGVAQSTSLLCVKDLEDESSGSGDILHSLKLTVSPLKMGGFSIGISFPKGSIFRCYILP